MSTFNSPPNIDPITLAKSSDINDIVSEVSKAFALLPDENAIKQGKVNYAVDTGSTANSYIVALSNTIASYEDGLLVSFRPNNSNTGAATINVNSLGAKSIRLTNGDPLSAGDINTGIPIDVRYSTVTGFFHLSPNSAAKSKVAIDSATTATTKAGEAAASANNAATSASSASNSATTATTKAGEAATSANNAATSANAASNSATTATTKAGEAATSATNAATSANAANSSAINAAESEANSITMSDAADLSAFNAAASESSASSSASSAATSATNASSFASSASTSATNAANSASSALNSAGTNATSATNMTIGTGSKSFTLAQAGKLFSIGQTVSISDSTGMNVMSGTITAFTSGTGAITVSVTDFIGSGTISGWTISVGGLSKIGNEKTFIATGEISSAGLAIALKTDGTVGLSANKASNSSGISVSTTGVANDAGERIIASCYNNNDSKILVAFNRYTSGSNKIALVVGSVTGSDISFGSIVDFNVGNHATDIDICYDTNNKKYVVTYSNVSGANTQKLAVVVDITGGVIAVNTPVAFSNDAELITSYFDELNGNVVVVYASAGLGKTIIGTVYGNTISFGTESQFLASYPYACKTTYSKQKGKGVITWIDSTTKYHKATVCTLLGGTPSFGAAVSIPFSNFGTVLGYSDITTGSNGDINIAVGNASSTGLSRGVISGTDITFSNPTFISNVFASKNISISYNSLIEKTVICYLGWDGNSPLVYRESDMKTDNIIIGDAISNGSFYDGITSCHCINQGKTVALYKSENQSNAVYGVVVGNGAYSNLDKVIGISASSASHGQSISVKVGGAVSNSHSGLIPITKYYAADNGALTTISNGYPTIAYALSTTSAIVTAGLEGITGATGAQGIQGIAGENGATWYSGVSPTGGVDGDYYFKTDTSDIYKKVTGSWGSPIANIKGATGAQGIQGIQGVAGEVGANGATWLSGSGVPAAGTGADNDYYFRTDTSDIYKKTTGSWGSPIANIKGATGTSGGGGGETISSFLLMGA